MAMFHLLFLFSCQLPSVVDCAWVDSRDLVSGSHYIRHMKAVQPGKRDRLARPITSWLKSLGDDVIKACLSPKDVEVSAELDFFQSKHTFLSGYFNSFIVQEMITLFIKSIKCCTFDFSFLSRVLAHEFCKGNHKVASVYRRVSSPLSVSFHFTPKLSMEPKLYRPPPEVRGMTVLDKEAFTQTIAVPALRVPTGVLNKVVKSLKKSTIQRPGVPRVVQDKEGCSDFRLVLLDPHKVSSPDSFSEAEAEALRSFSVAEELHDYELQLTYHNLKSEEVLEAVLPQGQDVTSSFSRVGHIAHMNLRDHQLPYKSLIGEQTINHSDQDLISRF